ncbi:High frequency lysogenization protein HflD homolog [Gammaproteobacteria bacterium]
MSNKEQDRTIALAGVFQAAYLAQIVADSGLYEGSDMAASISSLFQNEPDNVIEVFGGVAGVVTGLRRMSFLRKKTDKSSFVEQIRKTLLLIDLAKQLSSKPEMLAQIADGIEQIRPLLKKHHLLHDSVLSHLAKIYTQTISNLSPRVQIQGDPECLQIPENVNRIRSLLLAGIRAAVLWHQVGGSRWRLFFFPWKVQQSVSILLEG